MSIGQRIEDLKLYGFQPGEVLTEQEREDIVAFARRFEECGHSREELEAMDAHTLIGAAYSAMLDYARGQL